MKLKFVMHCRYRGSVLEWWVSCHGTPFRTKKYTDLRDVWFDIGRGQWVI